MQFVKCSILKKERKKKKDISSRWTAWFCIYMLQNDHWNSCKISFAMRTFKICFLSNFKISHTVLSTVTMLTLYPYVLFYIITSNVYLWPPSPFCLLSAPPLAITVLVSVSFIYFIFYIPTYDLTFFSLVCCAGVLEGHGVNETGTCSGVRRYKLNPPLLSVWPWQVN